MRVRRIKTLMEIDSGQTELSNQRKIKLVN